MKHKRPANVTLSEKQAERLAYILACGPCIRKPIDEELEFLGWVEPYDDDPEAVDQIDGAAAMFYDETGRIKDHWKGWKYPYER